MSSTQRFVAAAQLALLIATVAVALKLVADFVRSLQEARGTLEGGASAALLGIPFILLYAAAVVVAVILLIGGLVAWRVGHRWVIVAADLAAAAPTLVILLLLWLLGGLEIVLVKVPWVLSVPILTALAIPLTLAVPPPSDTRAAPL